MRSLGRALKEQYTIFHISFLLSGDWEYSMTGRTWPRSQGPNNMFFQSMKYPLKTGRLNGKIA
jgi:hypothetical protein